jgi:site-specific DNA-cytosine methylase
LSLFTGIGGAEVALHKIGIKLNVVVSVEIQEDNRACVEAWWRASGQTGILDQTYHNVMSLGRNELRSLLQKYGGFDLIVGGSPCQNFSGNNRVNRTGLSGVTSIMFFEYSRVATTVREFVRHMPS